MQKWKEVQEQFKVIDQKMLQTDEEWSKKNEAARERTDATISEHSDVKKRFSSRMKLATTKEERAQLIAAYRKEAKAIRARLTY